jgi:hypothetical protein
LFQRLRDNGAELVLWASAYSGFTELQAFALLHHYPIVTSTLHPHLHLLTTDGGTTADGSWQPLPEWNSTLLMSLFRERLLARLVLAHAISPELVKKLLAWKHPGFSAHVGETIAPTDTSRESVARPPGRG